MMLNNPRETLENCRFCLMCRHVAPVGLVTDLETLTPHGIALIATSQKRGLIDWNDETVGIIYSEPDGGNSRAHCVFDQPHAEAVAAVRIELVEKNLAPPAVYEVGRALEKWQTPFAQIKPEPASGQGTVALFVGDEAAHLWPQTIPAVLKLLKAVGVDPVLIGRGRNSGLLATSLGFPKTAETLVEATYAELKASGAAKMLVLSAGDYFAFHQAFDERLGLGLPAGVELQEVVTFLAENLADGRLAFARDEDALPYAYVDPTHAVRHPSRHEAPRQLAAAVYSSKARELFWSRENAHPVGSTHLQFSKPDLAEKLTLARLEDACNSGVHVLITEDPGTLYHLRKSAGVNDFNLYSLYEVLADKLI